jgi:hypothetical protein
MKAPIELGSIVLAMAIILPISKSTRSTHSTVVAMALPSPFTLPHSQFNEFLFAPIGQEGNGMPLSVISALARLEVDPWQEAARLADLPKELAIAALDRLIRRLPAGGWDQAETPAIVARLIELLPRRGGAARPEAAPSASGKNAGLPAVIWLVVVALGAAALFGALAHGAQRLDDPGVSSAFVDAAQSSAQP